MNCPYCRAQNDSDNHRCGRCGRRLNDDAPMFPVQTSAAVPVIDVEPHHATRPEVIAPPRPQLVRDVPREAPAAQADPVQASLFGPMAVVKPQAPKAPRTAPPSSRRRSEASTQQRFNFETHTLPTSVAAQVSCDAPVALAAHRAVAAAIDVAIPLLGVGLFFATLRLVGEQIVLAEKAILLYAVTFTAITVFYRLLCCIGNVDSIGLQWSGLQLLHFHGHRPRRRERFRRLAGGLLSTVALGMGLFWSLADEEHLTWHDYISNTFPTPRNER